MRDSLQKMVADLESDFRLLENQVARTTALKVMDVLKDEFDEARTPVLLITNNPGIVMEPELLHVYQILVKRFDPRLMAPSNGVSDTYSTSIKRIKFRVIENPSPTFPGFTETRVDLVREQANSVRVR